MNDAMILYAVRYCLGRQTYAPHECVDWLIENWSGLYRTTHKIIIREVKEAIKESRCGAEMDCDKWRELIKFHERVA